MTVQGWRGTDGVQFCISNRAGGQLYYLGSQPALSRSYPTAKAKTALNNRLPAPPNRPPPCTPPSIHTMSPINRLQPSTQDRGSKAMCESLSM